jgi:hypothetical protein
LIALPTGASPIDARLKSGGDRASIRERLNPFDLLVVVLSIRRPKRTDRPLGQWAAGMRGKGNLDQ